MCVLELSLGKGSGHYVRIRVDGKIIIFVQRNGENKVFLAGSTCEEEASSYPT